MLIYGFECRSCRHEFDALVDTSDERPDCPMCRSGDTVLDPVCRPTIRTSNRRRGGVFDMSSGSCPCGCSSGSRMRKRA
jgi:putative FmdB family regulatory protein